MKLRALVAALAALFALQSGVATAATNTSRTSGKTAAVAKKAAAKPAAKPVAKPKAVAAKAANKSVAAKKAAAKSATKGKVASKAQPTKKAAAKVNLKTRTATASASAASPPSLISAPPESSCAISCQSSMEAWQFLSVSRRSSSASKRLFSRSTGVSFSGAFHASGAESSFSISARRADREGWSKTPPERLELRGQRRDAAFQISKLKHWKSLSFG